MRELAPLYRSDLDGLWYVTRYADCKGLPDRDLFREFFRAATAAFVPGADEATVAAAEAARSSTRTSPTCSERRAHPTVEEMLRYDSPIQFTRRVAVERIERDGVAIEPGDDIVVLPGAGNRDPARFAEPDAFDLTRTDPARSASAGASTTASGPRSPGWGPRSCSSS